MDSEPVNLADKLFNLGARGRRLPAELAQQEALLLCAGQIRSPGLYDILEHHLKSNSRLVVKAHFCNFIAGMPLEKLKL